MVYEVPLKNVTNENMSAFGKYFNTGGVTPDFSDEKFDWWNEIGITDINGSISFGIVHPKYSPEFSERIFEQHNNTPEILIPIDEDIIVLLGKEDAFIDETPGPEDFEAFLVPRGAVLCVNPGIWHHSPMVKGASSRVVVIFKEKTSFEDIKIKDLSHTGLTIKVMLD